MIRAGTLFYSPPHNFLYIYLTTRKWSFIASRPLYLERKTQWTRSSVLRLQQHLNCMKWPPPLIKRDPRLFNSWCFFFKNRINDHQEPIETDPARQHSVSNSAIKGNLLFQGKGFFFLLIFISRHWGRASIEPARAQTVSRSPNLCEGFFFQRKGWDTHKRREKKAHPPHLTTTTKWTSNCWGAVSYTGIGPASFALSSSSHTHIRRGEDLLISTHNEEAGTTTTGGPLVYTISYKSWRPLFNTSLFLRFDHFQVHFLCVSRPFKHISLRPSYNSTPLFRKKKRENEPKIKVHLKTLMREFWWLSGFSMFL